MILVWCIKIITIQIWGPILVRWYPYTYGDFARIRTHIFVCIFWYPYCTSRPIMRWWGSSNPYSNLRKAASPVLDLGCPRALFKSNDKVCMPIIGDDIIHRIPYNRYEYNRQQAKYIQAGQQFISLCNFYLPCLWHEGHSSSLKEHPDNRPLSGSVRLR